MENGCALSRRHPLKRVSPKPNRKRTRTNLFTVSSNNSKAQVQQLAGQGGAPHARRSHFPWKMVERGPLGSLAQCRCAKLETNKKVKVRVKNHDCLNPFLVLIVQFVGREELLSSSLVFFRVFCCCCSLSACFFFFFFTETGRAPSLHGVSQKEKGLSHYWEVFRCCWHFQSSFSFFFPQHSGGGDHNLSSVITVASESSFPPGFGAGWGPPCAFLRLPLAATAGFAGNWAAGDSCIRQGALLPQGSGLPALLLSDYVA